MRFLAPITPAPETMATRRGRQIFSGVGCALCHTPSLKTRESDIESLSNKDVNLYSDLLVHNMGAGLADRIAQGNALGTEFRTAPLWGVGQRLFFLHDGRTSNLKDAILAHRSSGSEASRVIDGFENLSVQDQQSLLLFLRGL